MMGLVTVYVTELTLMKNQKTFAQRQFLLDKTQQNADCPEAQEYARIINDLCGYQIKLQQELYTEVHAALGITDDSVILASHETYEQRKQLFEHINEVLAARQDRFLSKFTAGKAYNRPLTHEESDSVYTWYAEQINEMNKAMQGDQ